MIKNMAIKNKKGQFYILTAVILISVLFSIIQASKIDLSTSKLAESNTKKLYEKEAKTIINNALYENLNATTELERFTFNFMQYKSEKNEKINLLYIYKDDDTILISNKLGANVTIDSSIQIENNKYIYQDNNNQDIEIAFEDNTYNILFEGYNKEFRSIMVEEKV
ncbi:hypothetical protein C0585_07305 [Candidatus Woesearchaeota archaeon]|nr:MAG: hypothetical protein C0585_07305 [Candidatus Woesearchaeota archaeon]